MSDEDEIRSIEDGIFADEAEESGNEGSDRNKNSGDEDKDKDDDKDKKRVVKKKTGPVKRIMLHEEMLCGPNGLTKLEGVFKDFKLRGRGYEKEDLDEILHKLEHWVHLLHPKYPFGQTLERIEFLGMRKKVLKTHMKKIRMGLITNFDTMDQDNLPDLVDSDVENMPGTEQQHKEYRIGGGTLESEMPTIEDDGDDDEFMAMIDRVTKNAESAVAADPDEDDPDPRDFIDEVEKGNGNVSEDEELMDLHHKLARDSDEEDNIFHSFTRNEQTTLLVQTPVGGRTDSRNSGTNDQTTVLIQTPDRRADSRNSDIQTNDQTTLLIQTPNARTGSRNSDLGENDRSPNAPNDSQNLNSGADGRSRSPNTRIDLRNSDTDMSVNEQPTLPILTERADSRNSDCDLRPGEPDRIDSGNKEQTTVPIQTGQAVSRNPDSDADSDSDMQTDDLNKTLELCSPDGSDAPENVKVPPLPEAMDESDL